MAYYVTTALGREVPLEDWRSLHGDTVLKVLYDHARSAFNPSNAALDVTSLGHATGMSVQDAINFCKMLQEAGLVEEPSNRKFRITQNGINFVHAVAGQVYW